MSVKVRLQEKASESADADTEKVTDSKGRVLTIREPDVLTESRLVRALGGDASANTGYMLGYVMPAAMVVAIDGDPCIFPMTAGEVDLAIKRLGREGLGAVMTHLTDKAKNTKEGAAEVKK